MLYDISQADSILGVNAIHWVLCQESYLSSRRPEISGWEKIEEGPDYCAYQMEEKVIVAFRGTQNLTDIFNDVELTYGNNNAFAKVGPAKILVEKIISDNLSVQLTGHSLGGALARAVGSQLGLGYVTFNEAAPPQNPVDNPGDSMDYHIVFDIISAWQRPGVIRIDKGHKPPSGWARLLFGHTEIQGFLRAHSLDNFSSKVSGVVISAERENSIWQDWWNNLNFAGKRIVHKFIGKNLPVIN